MTQQPPSERPDRLYKYVRLDENGHTLRIITDAELFFRCPLDFNDPFDSRCYAVFHGTERDRRLWCQRVVKDLFPRLSNRQQRMRANHFLARFAGPDRETHDYIVPEELSREGLRYFGITCFSERPDDILMWSHYADHHRGVCIEFDPRFLTPNEIKPVRYSDEYPIVNILAMRPDDRELGQRVLLRKATHWQYEVEWRMFGPVEQTQQFPAESITGVILGYRILEENIHAVRKAASNRTPPVPLYYARPKQQRYELEIVPVST